MTAQEAYLLARAYTDKVAEGGGAAKGAACQIKSITAITGGHRITFEWEDNAGNVETDTMDVMDGADGAAGVGISTITYKETDAQGNYVYTITLTSGNTYDITCPKGPQGAPGADGQDGTDGADGAPGVGIASITKTGTSGLVDTYTITYTNGTTSTFTVTNGQDGDANEFIGTLAQWEALTAEQKKAYDTYQITDDFDPSEIAIPTASASKLGGIKVGDGLSIDANGVLSAEASGGEWSTTEHVVGKWIDGSDVYERTIAVTLGGAGDTDRLLISGLAPTRAWIVDSDFVYNTGSEQLHFYLGARVNGVMTTGFLINKSDGLYVRINNNYAGVDGLSGYVTIRYVKPTA